MSSGGKTRVGRGPVPRRSLTDKCGQSCTRSRPSSVSWLVVNQPLPGFGPFHGHSCKAKLFLSLLFWDPLDFASYELMFKELYSYIMRKSATPKITNLLSAELSWGMRMPIRSCLSSVVLWDSYISQNSKCWQRLYQRTSSHVSFLW